MIPALPMRGAIEVPPAEHHRHLSESEPGAFWRSEERQGAHFATIASTKLLKYSRCRNSEVLRARWREFDLEKGQWDLPAEGMKMKQPHRVHDRQRAAFSSPLDCATRLRNPQVAVCFRGTTPCAASRRESLRR